MYSTLPKKDKTELFLFDYKDQLQQPLQPLFDNLTSATYEVFEEDPTKYKQYERAIYRALIEMKGIDVAVVTVAGAGRG